MKKGSEWEDISFILTGKHRKNLLKLLNKPKTPTMVKEETNLHFNQVSRTLIELENKKLIECLNPKQKLIRLYQITNKGKTLLKKEILN